MEVKITLTQEQVAAIAAQMTGAPEAPAAPAVVYPRVETVNGVRINLKAPINPAWTTGGYTAISFYNPTTGLVMDEPSNGNGADKPYRSAAGWPMRYATGTAPWIMYDGGAFSSDAEVAAYRKDVADKQAAQDAAGEQEFLSHGTETGHTTTTTSV